MASTTKTLSKANLTITFAVSCSENNGITVELDDELNDGASCFLFGDKAYFRIYTIPLGLKYDIYITALSSQGAVHKVNTAILQTGLEQDIEFIEEVNATTEKPIKDLISCNWYGRNLGVMTKADDGGVKVAAIGSKPRIGIANVRYTSQYDSWYLTISNAPEDTFPVIVYIVEREDQS